MGDAIDPENANADKDEPSEEEDEIDPENAKELEWLKASGLLDDN